MVSFVEEYQNSNHSIVQALDDEEKEKDIEGQSPTNPSSTSGRIEKSTEVSNSSTPSIVTSGSEDEDNNDNDGKDEVGLEQALTQLQIGSSTDDDDDKVATGSKDPEQVQDYYVDVGDPTIPYNEDDNDNEPYNNIVYDIDYFSSSPNNNNNGLDTGFVSYTDEELVLAILSIDNEGDEYNTDFSDQQLFLSEILSQEDSVTSIDGKDDSTEQNSDDFWAQSDSSILVRTDPRDNTNASEEEEEKHRQEESGKQLDSVVDTLQQEPLEHDKQPPHERRSISTEQYRLHLLKSEIATDLLFQSQELGNGDDVDFDEEEINEDTLLAIVSLLEEEEEWRRLVNVANAHELFDEDDTFGVSSPLLLPKNQPPPKENNSIFPFYCQPCTPSSALSDEVKEEPLKQDERQPQVQQSPSSSKQDPLYNLLKSSEIATDLLFRQELATHTDDDEDAYNEDAYNEDALFDIDTLLEEEEWSRLVNGTNADELFDEEDEHDLGILFPVRTTKLDQIEKEDEGAENDDSGDSSPLLPQHHQPPPPEENYSYSEFYCQPCTTPFTPPEKVESEEQQQQHQLRPPVPRRPQAPSSLAPIDEAAPLEPQDQKNDEDDNLLYKLHLLSIDAAIQKKPTTVKPASSTSNKVRSDPYNNSQRRSKTTMDYYQHYHHPQALEAATPFLDAFGCNFPPSSPDDPHEVPPTPPTATKSSQKRSTEKSCLGHKETIFGVSFSECGTFCATASQDSTVRIWHVPTNSLLSTLTEHSPKYECLRIVWATYAWSDQCLDRSTGSNFRQLVASGGADGIVKLWGCSDPQSKKGGNPWKCLYTLDHFTLLGRGETFSTITTGDAADDNGAGEDQEAKEEAPTKEDTRPQVYALQFIDDWKAFTNLQAHHVAHEHQNSFLMTSSDDYLHFWELEVSQEPRIVELEEGKEYDEDDGDHEHIQLSLREVMSIHFAPLENYGYGVSLANVTGRGMPLPPPPRTMFVQSQITPSETTPFGGERNPDNIIYVFDAAYCSANGLLGAALSDGSLRLVNGRGVCLSVLTLPGVQSHLTSFAWDDSGHRLATCVAAGHLIAWTISPEASTDAATAGSCSRHGGYFVATCTAIMEGGHQEGRPLYGCCYVGKNSNGENDLLMSWGVDGRLCLWDSYAQGNIHAPIAVLRNQADYPIYAVVVGSKNSKTSSSDVCIALGGGPTDGGFIGVPVHLYTVQGSLHLQAEPMDAAASSIPQER